MNLKVVKEISQFDSENKEINYNKGVADIKM